MRIIGKPERAGFQRHQHRVPVEDRRRLAQLDASVQATVDAQPAVLGHLRLQKLDLFREHFLEPEHVRVDGAQGVDHQRLAPGPDVVAVLSIRRADIECHHLEREGRVIPFCWLGKECQRTGTQHHHSQDMEKAAPTLQRWRVSCGNGEAPCSQLTHSRSPSRPDPSD